MLQNPFVDGQLSYIDRRADMVQMRRRLSLAGSQRWVYNYVSFRLSDLAVRMTHRDFRRQQI